MGREHEAARRITEIIPLVMCSLAASLYGGEHDLIPAHLRTLGMLARHARSLSELAEMQAVSLPTVSNSVATLEGRGWIRRLRDASDRRVVKLELTPAGRSVLEGARRQVEAHLAQALSPLSESQQRTLIEGLDVLRAAFAAHLENPSEGEALDERHRS